MQLSLKADEEENEMDGSEMSEEENSECNDMLVKEGEEASRKKQLSMFEGIEKNDFQPVALSESYSLGESSYNSCSMNYSSPLTTTSCIENSESVAPQDSPMKTLACLEKSQVSVSPVSSTLKELEGARKHQQLQNYVLTFQGISTESLVLQISAFIPILEKIQIGDVHVS